ncbi:hypothetical protein WMY93_015249 [Mugilogobius chulae]|uniref:Protein C10 n=1 Tax=Mugilogobius chulae TaxID=88201 RepID=A0AAW0NSA3_9GOBI
MSHGFCSSTTAHSDRRANQSGAERGDPGLRRSRKRRSDGRGQREACNDMGKMLQLVLPVATQIQQEVIKAYGFNNEGEGVLKFARLVKMYETQDPEIAAMSAKLKSLLLPPLSTPPIGGAIPAS